LNYSFNVKKLLLIVAALALVAAPLYLLKHERRNPAPEPVQILSRYLKASYARDLKQAYRFISSKDKQLKPEKVYLREQGAFRGFALEAARKVAEYMTVSPLQLQPEGERVRVKVRLKLPDANSLAQLLMDWDEDRLNALSFQKRQKLLAEIDKLHRNGKIKMMQGEEEFLLVEEGETWKVFLDWGEGLRVKFDSIVPTSGLLEAQPIDSETIVRSSEPFTITYRIRNRSEKVLSMRVVHKIEPEELRQYLDIIDCALILPVTLLPGKQTEYSSTYLLRPDLPAGVRRMSITYEFKLES
jgi:cytochrome c oxidase assembly protein CtaG/Cox11